jgi:hypothetical protein
MVIVIGIIGNGQWVMVDKKVMTVDHCLSHHITH